MGGQLVWRRKSSVGEAQFEIAKAMSGASPAIAMDVESLIHLEQLGIEVAIPEVFFDVEGYNHIGLVIYRVLLEAFADCADLLQRSHESRYPNLVGVFFHELQRRLCEYWFRRHEMAHSYKKYRVDSAAIVAALAGVSDRWMPLPGHKIRTWTQILRDLALAAAQLPRRGCHRVLCTPNATVNPRHLASVLNLNHSANVAVGMVWPSEISLGLPRKEAQLAILRSKLEDLGRMLGDSCWLNQDRAAAESLLRWLRGQCGADQSVMPRSDVVLAGSLLYLPARIAAVVAKSRGVPVISLWHGENYGVLDEPVFGYGECSFSDVVVAYGQVDTESVMKSRYLRPLYAEDVPRCVSTSADKVSCLYVEKPIAEPKLLSQARFTYVPTSFSGLHRYGPFRDLHDVAYYHWQRGLMAVFGERFHSQVIWKRHAKEKQVLELSPITGVRVETQLPFESFLSSSDIFIFDYVSTALCLAVATDKPVVFFDIGVRNLTEPARQALKERCFFIEADPRLPAVAFERLMTELTQRADSKKNRFTAQFCLAEGSKPRVEVVADVIRGELGLD